jgi:hypothetical protein
MGTLRAEVRNHLLKNAIGLLGDQDVRETVEVKGEGD